MIFGYEIPHFIQTLCSEKSSSSFPIMTFTSPSDSLIANSISSVSLFRNSLESESSLVSLSTISSMVCFLFSSRFRSSTSSSRYVSLSIITRRKPLESNLSSRNLYCPFLFFINGETMETFSVEPFILLSTFFVISSIVWDSMGLPHFGQCG